LQSDHVERACRAALAAKAASDALNIQFEAEGLPPFAVRLGIHFGDAVVGNVGSAERMNYTVLGNSVNLAARLEGLNKEYGRRSSSARLSGSESSIAFDSTPSPR
jgi:adenylate cyclase